MRQSDIVVLLLGAQYGDPQESGRSATHEEYREAREGKRVLGFVQEGIDREPKQKELVREVQDWGGGIYTESFSTPDSFEEGGWSHI